MKLPLLLDVEPFDKQHLRLMTGFVAGQVKQHPFRCHVVGLVAARTAEILQAHSLVAFEQQLTHIIEQMQVFRQRLARNTAQAAILLTDPEAWGEMMLLNSLPLEALFASRNFAPPNFLDSRVIEQVCKASGKATGKDSLSWISPPCW